MKVKKSFYVGLTIALIGIICLILSFSDLAEIIHVPGLILSAVGVITMICGLVNGVRNTAIVISASIFLALTAIGWIIGMMLLGLISGLLCAAVFFAIVMLVNKLCTAKKNKTE